MTPRAVNARNAGLDLISRLNRWIVSAAVILTGAISLLAARSFHGHSTSSSAATQSSGAGSSAGSSSANSSGDGLQPPSQVPSSAVPATAPVVSSGGS